MVYIYIGTTATVTVTGSAFLTSAQLGSYDITNNNIVVQIFGFAKEANSIHFSAIFVASLITTNE